MRSRLNAGDLNQRITIKQLAEVVLDSGQVQRTPSDFATGLPAMVEQVSGGEVIRGRQVSGETRTLLTVRWLTGVTTEMKVLYEGRTLDILRANDPYGDRRELRIECGEGT